MVRLTNDICSKNDSAPGGLMHLKHLEQYRRFFAKGAKEGNLHRETFDSCILVRFALCLHSSVACWASVKQAECAVQRVKMRIKRFQVQTERSRLD